MTMQTADALVLFGATGDLAYKKIFPSLHAMVARSVRWRAGTSRPRVIRSRW